MQSVSRLVAPSSSRQYAATIIGASGAVGSALVKELLASSHCSKLVSFGRRTKEEFKDYAGSEKLTQHVIDLDKIEEEVSSELKGIKTNTLLTKFLDYY